MYKTRGFLGKIGEFLSNSKSKTVNNSYLYYIINIHAGEKTS